MALKGNIQLATQSLVIGSSDAEEIFHELINQHKARKAEDPVRQTLKTILTKCIFNYL